MDTIPLEMAIHVGSYIIAAVVFVVGVKFAVAGLRTEVSELKNSITELRKVLERLRETDASQDNRLSVLEAESRERLGWMKRLENDLSIIRAQISDIPR